MSDGVVELQKAMQCLSSAHNAYHGGSFCKQFAVKSDLAGLSDEQRKYRQALLRMLGGLIDTDLEQSMDALVVAWIAYKQAKKGQS